MGEVACGIEAMEHKRPDLSVSDEVEMRVLSDLIFLFLFDLEISISVNVLMLNP